MRLLNSEKDIKPIIKPGYRRDHLIIGQQGSVSCLTRLYHSLQIIRSGHVIETKSIENNINQSVI